MRLSKLFKKSKKRESVFWQKSYSQDGEDVVLNSYFSDFPEYKGFYLDIGALHPLRFSNTQMFYEKGWRGINIDATPNSMQEFKKLRPEDINLEYGISGSQGELTYYLYDEPALNNSDLERTQYLKTYGYDVKEEVKIKTMPINQILEKYLPQGRNIDFIDVDVEGLDYVDNDFVNYQNSQMYNLLSEKGYRVLAKTMRTVIFGLKTL